MGRFESPLQVVGLFIAASIASIGIIFFINAEANSRHLHQMQNNHKIPQPDYLQDDDKNLATLKNEVGASFMEEEEEEEGEAIISEVSSLSPTSSELTSSNYTSGGAQPPPPSSSSSPSSISSSSNVTLLNLLEDGLDKLLFLIKQVKHTYKTYYLSRESRKVEGGNKDEYEHNIVSKPSTFIPISTTTTSSMNLDTITIKVDDNLGKKLKKATVRFRRSLIKSNHKSNRRRRRRLKLDDRQATTPEEVTMFISDSIKRRMKRASTISSPQHYSYVVGRKRQPSVQNEPYYWQMLEDNNNRKESDKNQNHHHQKKVTGEANEKDFYYSMQYPNLHSPNTNQLGRLVPAEENHYLINPVPGAIPAVASAFTSNPETTLNLHSSSSGGLHSSSDFHKIRHAMNKLGGGGLDISVVERMILDTKSGGGRRHSQLSPSSSSSQNHHNRASFQIFEKSPSNEALLTTATTKTTHPGRQDESLYVNQLRHQQEQLAQSLLPPTVTFLNGQSGEYLPLPSSSRATGFFDDDGNDSRDDNEENSESHQVGDDDNENENQNNDYDLTENEIGSKRRKVEKIKSQSSELSYLSTLNAESNTDLAGVSLEDEIDAAAKGVPQQIGKDTSVDGNQDINKENDMDLRLEFNGDDDEDDGSRESFNIQSGSNGEKDKRGEQVPTRFPTYYPTSAAVEHDGKDCYKTDDVLIVVAITCCLNFAFVLVIWALVRWFSISNNPKEKDFQNLGDCDDTLDPTVVFHGVTEDPCWALATKEASMRGNPSLSGMRSTIGGTGSSHYERGRERSGSNYLGSIKSSNNRLDLVLGERKFGGGSSSMVGTSSLTNTIGTAVMTMERRSARGSRERGERDDDDSRFGTLGFNQEGLYIFRPEHMQAPHGKMHRSYSQSMEDLRYLQ